MQCGAIHYLLKPFGFPALQDKLVAYQAMRWQLNALQRADQSSVDRLYSTMSGAPVASASSPTLEAIEELLANDAGELSASEVAAGLGTEPRHGAALPRPARGGGPDHHDAPLRIRGTSRTPLSVPAE